MQAVRLVEDHAAAGFVEAERDVDEVLQALLDARLELGLDEQQQEAAAAGAEQLAADRARVARGGVELVDLGGRDLGRRAPS